MKKALIAASREQDSTVLTRLLSSKGYCILGLDWEDFFEVTFPALGMGWRR